MEVQVLLSISGISRPRARRDVADCPDARHVGAAHSVGGDDPALGHHAHASNPISSVFGTIPMATMAAELVLGDLAVLGLDLRRDALAVGLDLRPPRPSGSHALLGQRLLEERGDVGIFDGYDPVHHFDDGHVRAHVIVKGELDADRARSDDQQFTRHLGRHHGVAIGPDALAIGRCGTAGRARGRRSRR